MRCIVLICGQKFLWAALLELGVITTTALGQIKQVFCDVELPHVVAANLSTVRRQMYHSYAYT